MLKKIMKLMGLFHIKMISRNSSLKEIKKFIIRCLDELYEKDGSLFELNDGKGISERGLVFRFAYYLQKNLNNYYVDCDFNSSYIGHFENGKLVWERRPGKAIENQDGTTTNRFVDIIIHKRHEFQNNEPNTSDFLCFEIKKWKPYTSKEINKDINNLKVMTSQYGYIYGFHIFLHRIKEKTKWTIFQNGNQIIDKSFVFKDETRN